MVIQVLQGDPSTNIDFGNLKGDALNEAVKESYKLLMARRDHQAEQMRTQLEQHPDTPAQELPSAWSTGAESFKQEWNAPSGVLNPGGVMTKTGAFAAGAGGVAGQAVQNWLAKQGVDPGSVSSATISALTHAVVQFGADWLTGKAAGHLLKGIVNTATEIPGLFSREKRIGYFTQKHLGGIKDWASYTLNPTLKQDAQVLYKAAEAAGPVPTKPVVQAVNDTIQGMKQLSTSSPTAIKMLQKFTKMYQSTGAVPISRLIKEAQGMRRAARTALAGTNPDYETARSLYKAREAILNGLDHMSDTVKAANRLAARDAFVEDVFSALEEGNPVKKLKTLIAGNQKIAATFGWDTSLKINKVLASSIKITNVGAPAALLTKLLGGGIAGSIIQYAIDRKIYEAIYHH